MPKRTKDDPMVQELIQSAQAQMALPRMSDLPTCHFCGKKESEAQPLLRCSACKTALYCDAKCQKAAWKTHKAQCALEKKSVALLKAIANENFTDEQVAQVIAESSDVLDHPCSRYVREGENPERFENFMGQRLVANVLVKWAPLHEAVACARTKVVQALLSAGVTVDIKNLNGETPLWVAAKRNWPEGVTILLAHGADPNIQATDGWSILMECSRDGQLEIVRELLNAGAKAFGPADMFRRMAVHLVEHMLAEGVWPGDQDKGKCRHQAIRGLLRDAMRRERLARDRPNDGRSLEGNAGRPKHPVTSGSVSVIGPNGVRGTVHDEICKVLRKELKFDANVVPKGPRGIAANDGWHYYIQGTKRGFGTIHGWTGGCGDNLPGGWGDWSAITFPPQVSAEPAGTEILGRFHEALADEVWGFCHLHHVASDVRFHFPNVAGPLGQSMRICTETGTVAGDASDPPYTFVQMFSVGEPTCIAEATILYYNNDVDIGGPTITDIRVQDPQLLPVLLAGIEEFISQIGALDNIHIMIRSTNPELEVMLNFCHYHRPKWISDSSYLASDETLIKQFHSKDGWYHGLHYQQHIFNEKAHDWVHTWSDDEEEWEDDGRCIAFTQHGKRCSKRSESDRCCKKHDPNDF